jgi:hypothetical protein
LNNIGCLNIKYIENITNISDLRYTYLLNNTIKNLNYITEIFLIGCNPRIELPILNSNIRKSYLNNLDFKIYTIGLGVNYITYPILNIGSSIKKLYKFFYSIDIINKYFLFDNYYNIYLFNKYFLINTTFIIGSSSLVRLDFQNILNSLMYFFKNFNISLNNLNILNRHLGRLSFYESNLYYNIKNKSNFYTKKLDSFNYLLGLDYIPLEIKNKNNINIYQGFFYISKIFEYINLVLPSTIYIEESSIYINLEGRLRYTNLIIKSFKNIISDINIIESLNILKKHLIIKNFSIFNNFFFILNKFNKIYNFYFQYLNFYKKKIENYKNLNYKNLNFYNLNFYNLNFYNSIFYKIIYNYYSSDIYSKNSKILTIMSNKINFKNFIN